MSGSFEEQNCHSTLLFNNGFLRILPPVGYLSGHLPAQPLPGRRRHLRPHIPGGQLLRGPQSYMCQVVFSLETRGINMLLNLSNATLIQYLLLLHVFREAPTPVVQVNLSDTSHFTQC